MVQHGTWLVADIYNGDYIDTVGRKEGWGEEIMKNPQRSWVPAFAGMTACFGWERTSHEFESI